MWSKQRLCGLPVGMHSEEKAIPGPASGPASRGTPQELKAETFGDFWASTSVAVLFRTAKDRENPRTPG